MNLFAIGPGVRVRSHHRLGSATITATGATLLYVTELVEDLDEARPVGSDSGENRGRRLQLSHVVNMAHTPLIPDAQTEFQYRLDALAATLRKLKWDVVTMLLFGFSEDKVPKRAKQIKATLIAFRPNNTPAAEREESLCAAMKPKASCPVVTLRKHSD